MIFFQIILGLTIVIGPLICIIMFFCSLSELIKDKKAVKYASENKDNNDEKQLEIKLRGLNEDIKKQKIRMIVTGIIGAVFIACVISFIIYTIRVISGEISIM